MDAEVLLLNPAPRRAKRNPGRSAAQRAATRRLVALNKSRRASNPKRRRRASRRRNPVTSVAPAYSNPHRRSRRRSNPALRTYRSASRRRTNPSLPSMGSLVNVLKDTAVMGAGAVFFDFGYRYIERMLPATLQSAPGQITAGSAVKLLATAAIGKILAKPTKGLAMKAAQGSLVVQIRDIAAALVPPSFGVAGRVGYPVPGRVMNFTPRVGPVRTTMGALMRPGFTPMVNGRTGALMQPGFTALVNGRRTNMVR